VRVLAVFTRTATMLPPTRHLSPLGPTDFVSVKGGHFVRGTQPFYLVGTNIYDLAMPNSATDFKYTYQVQTSLAGR
jgi:hypothetical protein